MSEFTLAEIVGSEVVEARSHEAKASLAVHTDCEKLEKWDCYRQAKPNIEMIAREVIWQYKEQKKEKDGEQHKNIKR